MINIQTKFSFIILIFLVIMCSIVSENLSTVPEDIVTDLYLKYKEAVTDDRTNVSLRRLLKHNKQYEIHVKKLKEVNGFKIHNLLIKEDLRTDKNPLIYINNPVESKIPQAYLTLDEFKNILTNRVIKQRMELNKNTTDKVTKQLKGLKSTVTQNILRVNGNSKDSERINLNKIHRVSYNNMNIKSNVTKAETTDTKFKNEIILTKKTELNDIVDTTEMSTPELVEHETQSVAASDSTETTLITMAESPLTTNNDELDTVLTSIETSKVQLEVTTTPENVLETLQDTTASFNSQNTKEANTFKSNENNTSVITIFSMTPQITTKEKPRRKSTVKITSKLPTKTKRSTLGRPFVFLGNR